MIFDPNPLNQALIPPLLISLRMDGTLEWSWFGVTAPLWLPLGLFSLLLLAAPVALRRQFQAAAEPGADPQLKVAARASALACCASTVLLGCIVCTGVMYCGRLDDIDAGWTFQQVSSFYPAVEFCTAEGSGECGYFRRPSGTTSWRVFFLSRTGGCR